MPLSPESRSGEPNARCVWEWRDFLKAMSELDFDVEQVDGVVFRFKAPDRWQNQVLVLHMLRHSWFVGPAKIHAFISCVVPPGSPTNRPRISYESATNPGDRNHGLAAQSYLNTVLAD
ncbi:hypothetical protein ACG7TL_008844 [Trametes sanguinea]